MVTFNPSHLSYCKSASLKSCDLMRGGDREEEEQGMKQGHKAREEVERRERDKERESET